MPHCAMCLQCRQDLVQVILEGSSIEDSEGVSCVPTALSIAQLLVFNAARHTRQAQSQPIPTNTKVRHKHAQETPLPLLVHDVAC